MTDTMTVRTYRWQFCDREGNRDITGDMNAEQDATEVRAWEGAHGDICLVAMERTPRGRWRITTSDIYDIPVSGYDKRFGSPLEALEWLAGRAEHTLREAVCRCGDGRGEECD